MFLKITFTSFPGVWVSRAPHSAGPEVNLPMLDWNWCQLFSKLCLKLIALWTLWSLSGYSWDSPPISRARCLASGQARHDLIVLTSPQVPYCCECFPMSWAPWQELWWEMVPVGRRGGMRANCLLQFCPASAQPCHLKSHGCNLSSVGAEFLLEDAHVYLF